MQNVFVVTTLPNAAIQSQIGPDAFRARINVSREAAKADVDAGLVLFGLCEPEMEQHFADIVGLVLVPDPGSTTTTMGFGRRLVIKQATDLMEQSPDAGIEPVIIWREPEKNLVRFVPDLIRPIQDGDADIVIPRRRSLASYPTFSQYWEQAGSIIASSFIGNGFQDYWVGPRAFNYRAAQYFLKYPGDQQGLPDGHDSIFCPLIDAAFDGLAISGVEIDFTYPPEQRDAEEHDAATMIKRMKVMMLLTKAMAEREEWNLERCAEARRQGDADAQQQ